MEKLIITIGRLRLFQLLTFSQPLLCSGKVIKKTTKLSFWIRPGRIRVWWDNFVEDNGSLLSVMMMNSARHKHTKTGLCEHVQTASISIDTVSKS